MVLLLNSKQNPKFLTVKKKKNGFFNNFLTEAAAMQPNYESTVCMSCVGPLRHVQCLPACPAPGRIPCSSGLLPAISKLKLLLCKCCCSCCHGTQNQAGKEQGSCSSKENTNQTCKERASCTKERRSHCESRTWQQQQQQQQQQGSDPGDQGSTQCSHHKPEAPNQSKESNRGTQSSSTENPGRILAAFITLQAMQPPWQHVFPN